MVKHHLLVFIFPFRLNATSLLSTALDLVADALSAPPVGKVLPKVNRKVLWEIPSVH